MTDCLGQLLGPRTNDGSKQSESSMFSLQSLLTADPADNARLYLALYYFIPWHRLSPPFLLQSLSLLPQASPTVKTRDLKTDHTVTQ